MLQSRYSSMRINLTMIVAHKNPHDATGETTVPRVSRLSKATSAARC
jgi:hypothetical protein